MCVKLFDQGQVCYSSMLTNRPQRTIFKIKMPKSNQVSLGTNSLHIKGLKVWNALPFHIKSKENFRGFKEVVKFWND